MKHLETFKYTSVREEQLEQPKEAAVPESPKANDPEDRRENVSEQERPQVYHRDRLLAQSIHVHSSIQLFSS